MGSGSGDALLVDGASSWMPASELLGLGGHKEVLGSATDRLAGSSFAKLESPLS